VQITKLRLSGFKSFVHPTELLIEPGLTGIVGPNGCGKSNLVEALRWVMGETSARGLRGGEMDDVIFGGTAARPAYDLADVTVLLRRIDRALPQFDDAEELELSRRIGRGTGSLFRVNGREARARDVQLLFADASSGARSAAIVSQGQIGSLVEAKPTDRRRLLEAAAGVAGLQARRHEAELKLQAAEANLVRLQDLLTTLDEQHRALRKQAREAARYRELSAGHRDAEAALLVGRWQLARAELATAEATFHHGQETIAVRANALEQARERRDRAATALPELRQSEAAQTTDLARLSERLAAVIDELARLDDTKARLAERRQQIDQDVAHARTALADAGAMRQRLEEERAALSLAADQGAGELERSAAAERAAWDALEAADCGFRQALAAVAEVEARISQLVERQSQIAQQRADLDAAEGQARAALAELSAGPEPGDRNAVAQAEAELGEARGAAAAADAALRGAECLRLLTRRHELAAKAEQRAARRRDLGLAGLEQRQAEAKAAVAAAETDLTALRERASAADATRARIEAAVRDQRALVERLGAEADALAALAEPKAAGPGMVDLVEVRAGHAEALAAALGDDLIGGLDRDAATHWREQGNPATLGDAPALPAGCTPLSEFVKGPPALARRLGQIGVVDAARAGALQAVLVQGQRLVSPDGGLWRWDGFVRRPDAPAPGAARLHQRTRLRQLEDEGAQQRATLAGRDDELAAADEAARAVRLELEQAEQASKTATMAFEAARDAAAEARAADAGLAAELTALDEERARVDHEIAELTSDATENRGTDDATLPSAEQAQAGLAAARAAAAAAAVRLAAAQAELERARAAEHAAGLALREGELERARLHTRLSQLEQDRARLADAGQEAAAGAASAEAELTRAKEVLGHAQTERAARRQEHAEAGAEHVRLRDRQAGAAQRRAALDSELELWRERARQSETRLAELADRRSDLAAELTRLIELPATLRRQQTEHRTRIIEIEAHRDALGQKLAVAEAALGEAQGALDQAEAERVEAREAGARLEGRLEQARATMTAAQSALQARSPDLPDNLPDEPPDADELAALEAGLAKIALARERLGPVNLRAIDEVQELAMRIETLQAEQGELTAAIERLRRAIATLNREGRDRLRDAFAKVEEHFEALFVRLFGGGRAKLELTDLDDPLAAGLELAASPPGKKLQSVSLLSGGEKALTAIALIFAVFLTRPAPLCILDEVDAPLDDANVERLGALLEDLAQNTETRFVVITHNPLTMARMDRLYGVTMAERGISELVSVDLRRAVELRATA
jgi:chromosome segregation protein